MHVLLLPDVAREGWTNAACPRQGADAQVFKVGSSRTHTVIGYYSLRPKKSVVLGFCTTSLTRFVENTCNIFISK